MKLPTTTRRSFLGGSALAASTLLAACGGGTSGGTGTATTDGGSDFAGTINLSEDLHIQGYDWGAGVDKVVLTPDYPIDAISAEDLVVTEHKQATDWTAEDFPVVEADFPRTVTAATVPRLPTATTSGISSRSRSAQARRQVSPATPFSCLFNSCTWR